MSRDYILHFQPEIPQVIVAQEDSEKKTFILNTIKGRESMELINRLLGNSYHHIKTVRTKKA